MNMLCNTTKSLAVSTLQCVRSMTSHSSNTPLKPFHLIPGPKVFPIIGSMWKYVLPHKDRYDSERMHVAFDLKYKRYGPLVREALPGGLNLLSVFDPEDIKSFLEQTMRRPDRRSHLALKKYREDRPQYYSSVGLICSNGDEWKKIRKATQTVFGNPEAVLAHLQDTDRVMNEFMHLLRKMRAENGLVTDMLDSIKMMSLEVLLCTLFDFRYNYLTSATPAPEVRRLMEAGRATTQAIFKTDLFPIYRNFNSPLYKQLIRSQDYIYKVAKHYYEVKKSTLTGKEKFKKTFDRNKKTPILDYLVKHPDLSEKDILCTICDSLMAGVDTTSYSLAFLLYHVSRTPQAQMKLAEEAKRLMDPTGGKVNEDVLSKAKYTVAAVKEAFRLSPVSIGIGRVNVEDIQIRGFNIPAGTIIVSANQHICRNPKYFQDPLEFRPERFMRNATTSEGGEGSTISKRQFHSHASLPFGYGSRLCVAHNIAKQFMNTALLHFCYNFTMEWRGNELDCKVRLINEPDGPLSLTLRDHCASHLDHCASHLNTTAPHT